MKFLKRIIKLSHIVSNARYALAMLKGTAAGTEHTCLLQNMHCNYIVDIGANRGQFALVASQCLPHAKIISFEPLKEPASVFRRVFQSSLNVVLFEYAIGPREEQMMIHVSKADDSSSLLPISSLQTELFSGTSEKETRIIQVKPLHKVLNPEDIQPLALLKLDVQGFELQALEGCSSLIPLFSYIYVECSFVELYTGQSLVHEIISFLREYNFVLSGVYNLYYDKKGVAIQGDFLFTKKGSE